MRCLCFKLSVVFKATEKKCTRLLGRGGQRDSFKVTKELMREGKAVFLYFYSRTF